MYRVTDGIGLLFYPWATSMKMGSNPRQDGKTHVLAFRITRFFRKAFVSVVGCSFTVYWDFAS